MSRLEKDFGRENLSLDIRFDLGAIFRVPISVLSKNFDYPREDSSENSLCSNIFYTWGNSVHPIKNFDNQERAPLRILCAPINRFYTENMCLA